MKCLLWTVISLVATTSAHRQTQEPVLTKVRDVEINRDTHIRSITHSKLDFDLMASWETIRNLIASGKIVVVPKNVHCSSSGCSQAIEIKIANKSKYMSSVAELDAITKNSKEVKFEVVTTKETLNWLEEKRLVQIWPIERRCRLCRRRAFLTSTGNIPLVVTDHVAEQFRDQVKVRSVENTFERNLRSPHRSGRGKSLSRTPHRHTVNPSRNSKVNRGGASSTNSKNHSFDINLTRANSLVNRNLQKNSFSARFGGRTVEEKNILNKMTPQQQSKSNVDSHIIKIKQIVKRRQQTEFPTIQKQLNRKGENRNTHRMHVNQPRVIPNGANTSNKINFVSTQNKIAQLGSQELLQDFSTNINLPNRQSLVKTSGIQPLSKIRQVKTKGLQSAWQTQGPTENQSTIRSLNRSPLTSTGSENSGISHVTNSFSSNVSSIKQTKPTNSQISLISSPISAQPSVLLGQGKYFRPPKGRIFTGKVVNHGGKSTMILEPLSSLTRVVSPKIHQQRTSQWMVPQSGMISRQISTVPRIHQQRTSQWIAPQSGIISRQISTVPRSAILARSMSAVPRTQMLAMPMSTVPRSRMLAGCCKNQCRSNCAYQQMLG